MQEQEEIYKESSIDIKKLISDILTKKWYIAAITIIGTVIGIFYALNLPEQFTSTAKVLPELNQSSSRGLGSFSALAGLAGLDLENMNSTDAIRPNLYPDIIGSTPFSLEILNMPVVEQNGTKHETLGHFLNKKHEPSWFAKMMESDEDKATKNLKYSAFENFQDKKVYKFNKQQAATIKNYGSKVTSLFDKKTGVISISAKLNDPEIVGQVLENVLNNLPKYVTDYRLSKIIEQEQFLTQKLAQAEKRHEKARYNLSVFRDRNKNLFLSVPKTQEDELKYEYDLSLGLYNDLSKKVEQVKIQAQNEAPVIKILEPGRVPLIRSEPQRTKTVLTFLLASMILSTLFFAIKSLNLKTLFDL